MVAQAYEHGKAINTASFFEVDDVIDPADSRQWIEKALPSLPPAAPRTKKKPPPHRHQVSRHLVVDRRRIHSEHGGFRRG